MPKKASASRKPRRRAAPKNVMMYGAGFLDSVKEIAGRANKFLKDTKMLSTVGQMALNSGLVPAKAAPFVGTATNVADSLGYGRGRPIRM